MVRTMEGVETADQVLLMDGTVLENSAEPLGAAKLFVLGDLLPGETVEGFVFELDLALVVTPKLCISCILYTGWVSILSWALVDQLYRSKTLYDARPGS